jgi:PHP family Zn ribbon phosphoesterase
LLEVISVGLDVRSTKSKTVMSAYKSMREAFGPETAILTETPVESLRAFNSRIARVIESYREGSVGYVAGGGGRYGSIIAPWEVS